MSNSWPERVIQNSDDDNDDDGDSESSLEDLTSFLTSRISDIRSKQSQGGEITSKETSSFSIRSTRFRKATGNHSPVEAKPKYKYDLKSLAKSTQIYDDTEASSNRVREMLDSNNKSGKNDPKIPILSQEAILNTVEVFGDGKRHETDKIRSAIEKTEASFSHQRWYFFHPEPKKSEILRRKLSIASMPESWRHEMENHETRKQAFVSGFIEDLVSMGKTLPDDIFLWLIDEICWQECDVLRNAYIAVLIQSSIQIQRLVGPDVITKLFLHLNGTTEGINIKKKLQPIEEISDYYVDQDWSALLSTLSFFTQVTDAMSQEARTRLVCILLRMSADILILRNVDIFYHVQKTLENLCKSTSIVNWQKFCQETCESVYRNVEQPNLRLQIVESLSSVNVRTHDLRRRLACCFLFNNLIFAKKPSQEYFNFPMFLNRLKVSDFKCKPNTDYRELRALIMLMDIAVDDGQSNHLNSNDKFDEENFNINVEKLGMSVKEIFGGIGSQDNGNISKIQAKEAVDAFFRRITHTMRTKPKSVHEWFVDRGKERNNMRERQIMETFVTKVKSNKREN
ncbi:hypothetical protein OnM2_040029 [Erysiphe neolycopersici]|uniref:Uncharacterized protein n=1 Tax=Erysiphe neolycopersici TaxID=212602 RepID=A0A420HVW2_9PEZI|nr:hypothetical protein OnM2_040029 [Erysiphe neolycopersici]